MNFFVKDAALAIPAMHARRESFATELQAIALRYNVSFIMDWEFPQAVPWVLFNEPTSWPCCQPFMPTLPYSMTFLSTDQ